MTVLIPLIYIILLGLACAIWVFVWSIFEDTKLGAIIIDKIKHRKGGDSE